MPTVEKPPDRDLAPGFRIAERYTVVRKIGRGGEGDVFLVEEDDERRLRAIKVTRINTPDHTARTLRSAELLRKIDHRHVVRVTDAGPLPDGTAYVATEWVDGQPLRECFKKRQPTIAEVCAIGDLIADALVCVHAAGCVHRDVKPENILARCVEGVPDLDSLMLVDFGVSQELRYVDASGDWRTGLGWISGTVRYMAPEQLAGRRSTPRTDLYCLGATIYELLFGQPVTGRDGCSRASIEEPNFPRVYTGPLVKRRLTQDIAIPADDRVPDSLRRLLARLLRRDPHERVASAQELVAELRVIRAECTALH